MPPVRTDKRQLRSSGSPIEQRSNLPATGPAFVVAPTGGPSPATTSGTANGFSCFDFAARLNHYLTAAYLGDCAKLSAWIRPYHRDPDGSLNLAFWTEYNDLCCPKLTRAQFETAMAQSIRVLSLSHPLRFQRGPVTKGTKDGAKEEEKPEIGVGCTMCKTFAGEERADRHSYKASHIKKLCEHLGTDASKILVPYYYCTRCDRRNQGGFFREDTANRHMWLKHQDRGKAYMVAITGKKAIELQSKNPNFGNSQYQALRRPPESKVRAAASSRAGSGGRKRTTKTSSRPSEVPASPHGVPQATAGPSTSTRVDQPLESGAAPSAPFPFNAPFDSLPGPSTVPLAGPSYTSGNFSAPWHDEVPEEHAALTHAHHIPSPYAFPPQNFAPNARKPLPEVPFMPDAVWEAAKAGVDAPDYAPSMQAPFPGVAPPQGPFVSDALWAAIVAEVTSDYTSSMQALLPGEAYPQDAQALFTSVPGYRSTFSHAQSSSEPFPGLNTLQDPLAGAATWGNAGLGTQRSTNYPMQPHPAAAMPYHDPNPMPGYFYDNMQNYPAYNWNEPASMPLATATQDLPLDPHAFAAEFQAYNMLPAQSTLWHDTGLTELQATQLSVPTAY